MFELKHSSSWRRNYQLKWLQMRFILRSKRLLLLLFLCLFLSCLTFNQMLCIAVNLFTWCFRCLILMLLLFFFSFIVTYFRENLPYFIAYFLFFAYSNNRFRDNLQSIAWTIQLWYLVCCLRHYSQIAK